MSCAFYLFHSYRCTMEPNPVTPLVCIQSYNFYWFKSRFLGKVWKHEIGGNLWSLDDHPHILPPLGEYSHWHDFRHCPCHSPNLTLRKFFFRFTVCLLCCQVFPKCYLTNAFFTMLFHLHALCTDYVPLFQKDSKGVSTCDTTAQALLSIYLVLALASTK